jgi:hypothetical protein
VHKQRREERRLLLLVADSSVEVPLLQSLLLQPFLASLAHLLLHPQVGGCLLHRHRHQQAEASSGELHLRLRLLHHQGGSSDNRRTLRLRSA